MSTQAKFGLFTSYTAKAGQSPALESFLHDQHTSSLSSPSKLQHIVLKYVTKLVTQQLTPTAPIDTQYLVFQTFGDEAARDAAEKALKEAKLQDGVLEEGVQVKPVEILLSKVGSTPAAEEVTKGLKSGMRVLMTAKEGKLDDLRQHVLNVGKRALETDAAIVWFGYAFPGTNTIGMMGLFTSDEARQATLESEGAKKLRDTNVVADIFAGPPDVMKLEIVAAKF